MPTRRWAQHDSKRRGRERRGRKPDIVEWLDTGMGDEAVTVAAATMIEKDGRAGCFSSGDNSIALRPTRYYANHYPELSEEGITELADHTTRHEFTHASTLGRRIARTVKGTAPDIPERNSRRCSEALTEIQARRLSAKHSANGALAKTVLNAHGYYSRETDVVCNCAYLAAGRDERGASRLLDEVLTSPDTDEMRTRLTALFRAAVDNMDSRVLQDIPAGTNRDDIATAVIIGSSFDEMRNRASRSLELMGATGYDKEVIIYGL